MPMPIQQMADNKATVTGETPTGPTLGAKIIRNALFGGLRYLLVAPIPFLMTPFILHKIGVSGYGTWAIFVAINTLTSLADLGMVGTLSKFVAEYYARKDFVGLDRLLNSGLTLFLLIALIVAGILWGTAPWLAGLLFRKSTVPRSELITLFRYFLFVIAANVLTLLFSSVTTGLQRLDLTNMLSAASFFFSALFGAVLLWAGWGLRGLVDGYMASALLTVLVYMVVVRALLPEIALNPFHFDKSEAKKMFGFSLRLYVTQAAVAVHNQIEKVFLASLVGVAAAGWYDIASDVAVKVRGAIGFILTPMLPANSELHALGDEARMRELYYRAHKYLALIGVPAVFYVALISSRFVELWVGSGLSMIALPLAVLVLVNFFNLTTGPGFLLFAGRGYLAPGVQSAMLGIVLNVFLSLGLIYKFGFAGAVVGTAASLFIASSFFIFVFHRKTGYPFGRVLRNCYLKPTLSSLFITVALAVVRPAKDLSWFGLVVLGFVFGGSYSVMILMTRFFDDYDWSKIEAFVPLVRQARRIGRLA